MKLYILRHGTAVEHGAPGYENNDDARPLTPKGERKLWRVTEAMKAMELEFDLILSSPLPRARQTAEIVADALKAPKKLKFSDDLRPNGSLKKLIQALNALEPQPENVLLSGHEPYLSGLVSLLVSGGPGLQIELKKGGLCRLAIEELRPGRCAMLQWLLTPMQMESMA
jgi:phosphohistidine phosphatase